LTKCVFVCVLSARGRRAPAAAAYAAMATTVHETGLLHIDGVSHSAAAGLTALAASSLTGNTWNGSLVLLRGAAEGAASVAAEQPTASGNADVAWTSESTLAVGDDRGNVAVYSLGADAALERTLAWGEHTQPVTGVAASPLPTRLASTSLDGTARVWAAVAGGEAVATLEHLPAKAWLDVQAHGAAWIGPSAELLATAASDGVARLWDLRAPRLAASRFAPHTAPLLCVCAAAAEHHVLAGCEAGTLRLYDVRGTSAEPAAVAQVHCGGGLCSLARPRAAAAAAGGTPGAHLVATGCEDGEVGLVDCSTAETFAAAPRLLRAHADGAAQVAWADAGAGADEAVAAGASGPALLTGGWDKRLLRHLV